MSEVKSHDELTEERDQAMTLDDEQRVKVLSPGTLVFKRFIRNKLAMVGVFILLTMFLFSFLGGALTPYGETEVFRTTEVVLKDYAGATYNEDFQFYSTEGHQISGMAVSQFILAVNNDAESFEASGTNYSLEKIGDELYLISGISEIATALTLKGNSTYKETTEGVLTDAIKEGYENAVSMGETLFTVDGVDYQISKSGKENSIGTAEVFGLATKEIFDAYQEGIEFSFEFVYGALNAIEMNESTFQADGGSYKVQEDEAGNVIILNDSDVAIAALSDMVVRAVTDDVFLSVEFKEAVELAIEQRVTSFSFTDEAGEVFEYELTNKDTQYTVRRLQETAIIDTFSAPGSVHILGTDGNGMDILTRLMFGGRISLMIGFVAVGIELFIGVILGGIAGYFGKWIDNIIMRIVDVFNCIPSLPLYIILGALMDFLRVDPHVRIYILCIILGILGWTYIARLVRGQILSLREQEFMIATEATGISVFRRIFKHLIPNVIPQLIVVATMGLGDIILAEATLSFLGLGVKYPYASWGNIINAVNDVYIMTNYTYVWIPAGFLILLTVLGFNFVGDGLRDAFDPKMKR